MHTLNFVIAAIHSCLVVLIVRQFNTFFFEDLYTFNTNFDIFHTIQTFIKCLDEIIKYGKIAATLNFTVNYKLKKRFMIYWKI